MKGFIGSLLASGVALWVTARFVDGISIPSSAFHKVPADLLTFGIIALVFGIANGLIKPVLKALTFPISLMTMGLVGIVINVGLLLGVAYVAEHFLKITFTVGGFPGHGLSADAILTAFIASIALGILTAIIGMVVHD